MASACKIDDAPLVTAKDPEKGMGALSVEGPPPDGDVQPSILERIERVLPGATRTKKWCSVGITVALLAAIGVIFAALCNKKQKGKPCPDGFVRATERRLMEGESSGENCVEVSVVREKLSIDLLKELSELDFYIGADDMQGRGSKDSAYSGSVDIADRIEALKPDKGDRVLSFEDIRDVFQDLAKKYKDYPIVRQQCLENAHELKQATPIEDSDTVEKLPQFLTAPDELELWRKERAQIRANVREEWRAQYEDQDNVFQGDRRTQAPAQIPKKMIDTKGYNSVHHIFNRLVLLMSQLSQLTQDGPPLWQNKQAQEVELLREFLTLTWTRCREEEIAKEREQVIQVKDTDTMHSLVRLQIDLWSIFEEWDIRWRKSARMEAAELLNEHFFAEQDSSLTGGSAQGSFVTAGFPSDSEQEYYSVTFGLLPEQEEAPMASRACANALAVFSFMEDFSVAGGFFPNRQEPLGASVDMIDTMSVPGSQGSSSHQFYTDPSSVMIDNSNAITALSKENSGQDHFLIEPQSLVHVPKPVSQEVSGSKESFFKEPFADLSNVDPSMASTSPSKVFGSQEISSQSQLIKGNSQIIESISDISGTAKVDQSSVDLKSQFNEGNSQIIESISGASRTAKAHQSSVGFKSQFNEGISGASGTAKVHQSSVDLKDNSQLIEGISVTSGKAQVHQSSVDLEDNSQLIEGISVTSGKAQVHQSSVDLEEPEKEMEVPIPLFQGNNMGNEFNGPFTGPPQGYMYNTQWYMYNTQLASARQQGLESLMYRSGKDKSPQPLAGLAEKCYAEKEEIDSYCKQKFKNIWEDVKKGFAGFGQGRLVAAVGRLGPRN